MYIRHHLQIWKLNADCGHSSFPGTLFSTSRSCWNRDPGCGWSRDYLSIQNCRVGGYSSAFGWEENPFAPPFQQIFLPPRFWVVMWPAATRVSVFQRLREADKRDPGNKVGGWPEIPLILGRSGTQYVAMGIKLLSPICRAHYLSLIFLQRMKHFWYKLAEISFSIIFDQHLVEYMMSSLG